MKIFNADRRKNLEFNDILQKIKYKTETEAVDGFIYFPLFEMSDRGIEHQEDPLTQILFNRLKEMGAIEFSGRTCDEMNKTLEESKELKNGYLVSEGYLVKTIEPKFSQLCEEYERKSNEKAEKIDNFPPVTDKYKISIKDREIWVNDYLLSKPHAVGKNLEFFEYVYSQPKNIKITKQNMPETQKINKRLTKTLNELGFKGEILKAFFRKRGKSTVSYMGNEITKKDLEEAGIKIPLFIKELETAHIKNNPN